MGLPSFQEDISADVVISFPARTILIATAVAAFSGYIREHWPANIRKLCITIVTLKKSFQKD